MVLTETVFTELTAKKTASYLPPMNDKILQTFVLILRSCQHQKDEVEIVIKIPHLQYEYVL